jgi:hypothetical protein
MWPMRTFCARVYVIYKYEQRIFNLDMYVTHTNEYTFTLYASEHNMFYFVPKYSQSGLLVLFIYT